MNILVIHEMDLLKSVVYEPHYMCELLALNHHNVFVIDCKTPNFREFFSSLRTEKTNLNRINKQVNIELIRPPTIALPLIYRAIAFLTHKKAIEKTIKEKKIDAILLYSVPTNGYTATKISKKLNIPIVFRSLDVIYALQKSALRRRVTKFFEKRVYKEVDRILAVTTNLASYTIGMGAAERNVRTIPLGVDRAIFSPNNIDPTLRTKLGFSEQDKLIVFVGTLYAFSGLEYIIKNFNLLGDDCKMVIVGGGPMLDQYREIATDFKDRIFLVGVKDFSVVPHYINISDVCISPFDIVHETDKIIPIKIMEYLSCGKPVVATPLKGSKEWLRGEEDGVIYARPGREFIDAVLHLLESKKHMDQLSKCGIDRIHNYHDWQLIICKIINELNEARSTRINSKGA
jgi:glycosyltransferase involved in cell wall biosynthesis